ncbi:MAG: hypothetical protein EOS41_14390 [Mesorhizobium sp.]|uniref:GTPase-associated system all-helical protein GASH n=1 Tax=Mesorhizobium sp. TaxID=1871066 RepID=UPI000FE75690|nr:GTPase-associated system all-helical protein GASH [Mesorhizobium sp.]RWE24775.1 MAG: hypothetical protein EOS41_14390 [Mesorhizobium sp.]
MSENENTFDFAQAYRNLQAGADRKIVVAREAAHKKARKDLNKSADKLVDLAFLAFDIPVASTRTPTWLEAIVKEKDPQFSLEHDRNEARITATILLADMIQSGFHGTPALVLTASLAGRRQTVDEQAIVLAARSALAKIGRNRGLPFSTKIAAAGWRDLSKSILAAKAGDPTAIHTALEAVAAEAKAGEARLVEKFNGALSDLTNENRRLAEEVDLLWWRMGRWSYLLDRSFSEIDQRALPFVLGADVAMMINVLPGPHGALGIIRDMLGAEADTRQTFKSSFEAISVAERATLLKGVKADVVPIASLHAGLRLFDDDSIAASISTIFEKRTGVSIETELTRFQIAVQAFYERMLIKSGWI